MAETETRSQSRKFFRSLVVTRKGRPRAVTLLVLLAALYFLGAGVILPSFARPYLEKSLSEALGVPCTIGRLTANPLTWKIIARDVRIPYPEQARDTAGEYLVRLERLEMALSPRSVPDRTLIISELRLIKPVFSLVRFKDGSLSPQLFFTGTPASPEEDDPDLFPLVVHNLTVRDGSLTATDALRGTVYSVTAINLAVPFASTLRTDRDVALKPALSAVVNGREVTVNAESRPFASSRRTVFTLRTRDMNLPDFRSYIQPYTRLTLTSGFLHTALTLQFEADADKAFDFSLAGTVEITDLSLADAKGTVFKTAKALVEAENVVLGPRRVRLNHVLLEKPETIVRRDKHGALDWTGFFFLPEGVPRSEVRLTSESGAGSSGPDQNAPGTEQGPGQGMPLQLVVNDVRITGGKVTWHDDAAGAPVRYTVDNIEADFSDVRSEGKGRADFSVRFGKGEAGFSAKGTATLVPMRLEGSFSLRNQAMAPFYPYLPLGTGLALEGGTVSAGGEVRLQYAPEPVARLEKGHATLAGVAARATGADAPLLAVRRVAAERVDADLVRRTVRVGRLAGSGLEADLTRGKDGGLILPSLPAPETPAPPRAQTAPWRLSVDALEIAQSRFAFTDETLRRTGKLALTDIAVSGKNFANHGNARWTCGVSAKPGPRGALKLSATGTLTPVDLKFSGNLDKVDLRFLSPYLREVSRLRLTEATLGGDFTGKVRRVPASRRGGEFSVAGNLGIYGTTLVHNRRELGGWGRMRVENFAYTVPASGGRTGRIDSITVNSPRLSVVIDEKGVSSLSRALERPGTPPENAAAPSPATRPAAQGGRFFENFSVGKISLSLGKANYLDQRVSPPYSLKVDNVNASLEGLSLDPSQEAVFTGGLMVNGAPVAVSAAVKGLFDTPSGSGSCSIRSLDVSRFTQYAEKYLGYPLRRGELSVEATGTLNGRDLSMHNSVRIHNLDLGKKVDSPHAPDMPLSAAVSILRDSNGDIALELPVSGTLGDPEFKLGGVVGMVIGNVILKTVSSPFSLVTGVVGGLFNLLSDSGPASAEIVFPVGEDTLDAVAGKTLRELGKELRKHPGAILEVTGVADWGEKNVLVDAWVDKALRKRKYDALSAEEKAETTPEAVLVGPEHNAREYSRLLFALYKDLPFVKKAADPEVRSPQSTRAVMRILRSRLDIGEKELLILARTRAVAVYRALSQGNIDIAARIRLRESLLFDAEKTGGRIASYARIRVIR